MQIHPPKNHHSSFTHREKYLYPPSVRSCAQDNNLRSPLVEEKSTWDERKPSNAVANVQVCVCFCVKGQLGPKMCGGETLTRASSFRRLQFRGREEALREI